MLHHNDTTPVRVTCPLLSERRIMALDMRLLVMFRPLGCSTVLVPVQGRGNDCKIGNLVSLTLCVHTYGCFMFISAGVGGK
jgi:hypothetical protein